MIRIVQTIDSITLYFDLPGIDQFIRMIGTVFTGETATLEAVPFFKKDHSEHPVTLMIVPAADNTLKISKTKVEISIDPEDVVDTLNRFRDAKTNPEALYPEWIQATKLATHRNCYLYVSFENELNPKL